MFDSDSTGNDSVRKKLIRTDFLFIDYKGRQYLHEIEATVHHLSSEYWEKMEAIWLSSMSKPLNYRKNPKSNVTSQNAT